MDPAVGQPEAVERARWVLLAYQLPREPSRRRVAVWRKLRDLGVLYLQDGVAAFRRSREEVYGALIAEAERIRRKAEMGGDALLEQLGKLDREFRAERRRDDFRSPLRTEAAAALKAARQAIREKSAGVEGQNSRSGG